MVEYDLPFGDTNQRFPAIGIPYSNAANLGRDYIDWYEMSNTSLFSTSQIDYP